MREKPPDFVFRREGGVILRLGLHSVRLVAVACQPEPSCRETVEWSTSLLFSNTKGSGFRANQNPGFISGLVCWPPVCFDKLAICQLCHYLWHVAWCWTSCMTYNVPGKNITMTSRMTPVFLVLSPPFGECVGHHFHLRKVDNNVSSIIVILVFWEIMTLGQNNRELSAAYFWISSLFLWVIRNDLAQMPNRWWFKGFSSSDLRELGFFWTGGYFSNGLRSSESTSNYVYLRTWTHLAEGGQSDQYTCSLLEKPKGRGSSSLHGALGEPLLQPTTN